MSDTKFSVEYLGSLSGKIIKNLTKLFLKATMDGSLQLPSEAMLTTNPCYYQDQEIDQSLFGN